MLIIAGARRVRKQRGLAADFCPVCRDYRPVLVTELRQVAHLYFVPVGRGKTLVSEVQCTRCGSIYEGVADAYPGFERSFVSDVVELARRTNPDIMARTRPRLEAEERVRAGTLSAQERAALITEPFVALDYMVRRRWGRGSLSGAAVLALAVAAGLLVAALTLGATGHGRDVALMLGAMTVPASAAATVALMNGPRAWVRRNILPRLVAALLPLGPSARELSDALERARLGASALANRIDSATLLSAMERAAERARTRRTDSLTRA